MNDLRSGRLHAALPGPRRRDLVERAAVPCIDVHNHLGRWLSQDGGWVLQDVDELLATMDACGVETIVNLDGRWGDDLRANLARYDEAHPGRFLTFCHLDWSRLSRAGRLRPVAGRPRGGGRAGAKGIKVWKDLGLTHRDAHGELRPARRPAPGRRVRRGRRARPAGPHPHRRPDRVLRPARRPQRAPRGARRPAGLVVRGRGAPDVRPPARRAGRAARPLRPYDVHRRARRMRRRGPGAGGPDAHRAPELPRRRGRPDGRDRPPAARLPPARRGAPRPRAVRHRRVPRAAGGLPPVVPVPRDRRRVLRLRPGRTDPAAGPLGRSPPWTCPATCSPGSTATTRRACSAST